jgi:hypothetical protein
MSNSTREKIISYLGAGVSHGVAAEAAGVTPAYVSQLLLEPGVLEEIALLKAGRLEQAVVADETVEVGEALALKQTIKLIPFIRTAREAASVYGTLNAAKRKAQEDMKGDGPGSSQHVTLVLPRAAKIMIQVNSDNQIVDVDGTTTAPLPSKALPAMAARLGVKLPQDVTTIEAIQPSPQLQLAEKAKQKDLARAHSILEDITTVIDGVQVVI